MNLLAYTAGLLLGISFPLVLESTGMKIPIELGILILTIAVFLQSSIKW